MRVPQGAGAGGRFNSQGTLTWARGRGRVGARGRGGMPQCWLRGRGRGSCANLFSFERSWHSRKVVLACASPKEICTNFPPSPRIRTTNHDGRDGGQLLSSSTSHEKRPALYPPSILPSALDQGLNPDGLQGGHPNGLVGPLECRGAN